MIEIDRAFVGFGQLGRGGALGYGCPETDGRVIVPYPFDEALSAHAPSTVEVTFHDPVTVAAASNVSCFASHIACYINWHHIGNLTQDIRRTPQIHLAPGRYTLRMQSDTPSHGAHTVWLITRDPPRNARVAVVAYTYYTNDKVEAVCSALFGSAARKGLLVHCVGVDERGSNLSDIKIQRTSKHLRAISDAYDYLIVLDAIDTIILADENELARIIGNRVLIGAERCSWPVRHPEWKAQFHDVPTPECYINSGVIAGPRELVLRAFDLACEVYRECVEGRASGLVATYRHAADNDQYCWQAAYLRERELFRRDYTCELSLSIGCLGGQLVNNPEAEVDGRRVKSPYGTHPAILHCCGPARSQLQLWYRALVL